MCNKNRTKLKNLKINLLKQGVHVFRVVTPIKMLLWHFGDIELQMNPPIVLKKRLFIPPLHFLCNEWLVLINKCVTECTEV